MEDKQLQQSNLYKNGHEALNFPLEIFLKKIMFPELASEAYFFLCP